MGVILIGLLVLAALAASFAVLVAIKAVLWGILLPIRVVFHVLFGVLFLPFLFLQFVLLLVGGLLMVIVGPVLLVGLVAGIIGLAVPLFPLLCIAFVVWVVMRSSRSTAIART
jgi:hypothetical protein